MTNWSLSPAKKKSVEELMFFSKDSSVIIVSKFYRWAEFILQSPKQPLSKEELKNEYGYKLGLMAEESSWEMQSLEDEYSMEITALRNVSDDALDSFKAAWEEDTYCAVEELGWEHYQTEYYYRGPLVLTNTDINEVFESECD